MGETPLKYLFPRVFSISVNSSATIASLGVWDGLEWHWLIPWHRALRPCDREERDSMFKLLKFAILDISRDDTLIWTPHKSGIFSVKSASFELAKTSDHVHQDIIKGLWKGLVPYRVEILVIDPGKNQYEIEVSKTWNYYP